MLGSNLQLELVREMRFGGYVCEKVRHIREQRIFWTDAAEEWNRGVRWLRHREGFCNGQPTSIMFWVYMERAFLEFQGLTARGRRGACSMNCATAWLLTHRKPALNGATEAWSTRMINHANSVNPVVEAHERVNFTYVLFTMEAHHIRAMGVRN